MQFYKTGHWVVFIKLGQKYASKDGIELAVFEAFGEVLSFGLGVAERVLVHLLTALLVNGVLLRSLRGLQRTQTNIQSKQRFVVELETGTHEI